MARGLGWEEDTAPADSWVARAKTGDPRAFEEIMRTHEARVFRTAYRLLGNREDGLDATQEVFLRFHKYLDKFDERQPIAPWLYRLTVNVCRDIGKKRRKHQAAPLEAAPEPVDATSAERALDVAEERRIVEAGLKTLAEKERAALVLRDIEGLSTEEVAEVLGSSPATVRSQISRARKKLKDYRDAAMGG